MQKPYTVKLRYKEGPRDWKNLFAITRFFLLYFTITGVKKIVRYIKGIVISRFVISKFHCK